MSYKRRGSSGLQENRQQLFPIRPHQILRMSAVQIVRGTAALPRDLEDRFRRAYGREMTKEERKFFGLKRKAYELKHQEARGQVLKAA